MSATTPWSPVFRQRAPPSRVIHSGAADRRASEAEAVPPPPGVVDSVVGDAGVPVAVEVRPFTDSKANPTKGLANRTLSTSAVPFFPPGVVVALDEEGDEVVVEPWVVPPAVVGAGVVEVVVVVVCAVPGGVDGVDFGLDGVDVAPWRATLIVTGAGGGGMATKRLPPSVVRTTTGQSRCPHGAVPSSQNSLGETSL